MLDFCWWEGLATAEASADVAALNLLTMMTAVFMRRIEHISGIAHARSSPSQL